MLDLHRFLRGRAPSRASRWALGLALATGASAVVVGALVIAGDAEAA